MAISFVPQRIYSSVFDLKPDELKAEGVQVVFADLDNTLVSYGQKTATPELLAWKESLNAAGIRLFLISNSQKPDRASIFSQSLGIDFIGHAGKPKRAGFQRALRAVQVPRENTVMIGDQIFTDILGANHAGIRSWLIQPVAIDTGFRWCRYTLEGLFRMFCRDDRRRKK